MNTSRPKSSLSSNLESITKRNETTDTIDGMKKNESKNEGGEASEAKEAETEAEALARAKKTAKNKRKKENAKKNKAESKAKVDDEEEILDLAVKIGGSSNESASNTESKGKRSVVEVSSSPPNFEIKPSPGKGLGLFATRDIKKGDVIFIEASLLPDTHGNTWWRKHGSYGVATAEKQKRFDALHSYCNCHQTPCMETAFMKIWDVNSFEVWTTALSASSRYTLVFENASRINHSCLPNARYGFTSEKHMVVRALRDLKPGEEVMFNYIGSLGNTKMRREGLLLKYGFVCDCVACVANRSVSYADLRLHGGIEFGRPEATVLDAVVINRHTAVDKEGAKRVGEWLNGLSRGLVDFRETVLPTIARRQKEDILDKGVKDVGQQNEIMARATLGLWMAQAEREQNNWFGFSEKFFAVALKKRLDIWRRLNEMDRGRDVFRALDNVIDCINGLLE